MLVFRRYEGSEMDISRIEELAELMKKHGLAVLSLRRAKLRYASRRALGVRRGKRSRRRRPRRRKTGPGRRSQNEIRSPMVGVFFSAGARGGPFVTIGQHVKKGDVLCVVEAMKLMNEITAERDCVISDICVENGQLVEYGQCRSNIFEVAPMTREEIKNILPPQGAHAACGHG